MPVKLHVGTREADGRIVLLDKKELAPQDECYVQLRLDEPVVVAPGDPFIVRLQTPMYTIGGGRVLDAGDEKLRRFKDESLMKLVEKEQTIGDEFQALEFAFKEMGRKSVTLKEVSVAAKAPEATVEKALKRFEAAGKIVRFDGLRFIHVDALEGALHHLKQMVEAFHQKNPLRAGLDLLVFRNESKMEEALFRRALDELAKRGVLAVENDKARLAAFAIKLSREDGDAAAEVERAILQTKFNTPRVEELYARFPKYNQDRVNRVLGLLVDKGAVVSLKDGVLLHRETVEEAKRLIGQAIRDRGSIDPGQVRELLGTSRKYVIPLLEHLDDVGFTVRVENKRVLRQK
jgi:selenocysteine-specific elongation factor